MPTHIWIVLTGFSRLSEPKRHEVRRGHVGEDTGEVRGERWKRDKIELYIHVKLSKTNIKRLHLLSVDSAGVEPVCRWYLSPSYVLCFFHRRGLTSLAIGQYEKLLLVLQGWLSG